MQVWVNGLIYGLLLSCVGLAFSLVYQTARVFHFAQAGVYAAAPFFALALFQYTGSWLVSCIGSVLASIAVSATCERANHRPLLEKGAGSGAHMISSLGIYLAIVQLLSIKWGNQPRVLSVIASGTYQFGGIIVTRAQLVAG